MNHKDLDVWNRSITLVKNVYLCTSNFPVSERFGLMMQMRRAAISIISNIADGAARDSDKELIQFLYHSLGSAAELETQIIVARELEFISDIADIDARIQQVKQLLIGLIRYLQSMPRN